jgi:hypothetical protein
VLDGGGGRVRFESGVEERKERAERVGRPRFCITFRRRKEERQRNAHSAASFPSHRVSLRRLRLPTAPPLVFHRFEASRRLTRCTSSCRKAPSKELFRLADRAGTDLPSPPSACIDDAAPPSRYSE